VAPKASWLFVEVLGELRAMISMFFDYRFRPAWGAYVSIIVLIAILVSGWWLPFSNLPIVGPILDKAVCLILALFVYKRLHREVRRYRDTIARAPGGYRRYV
jgi:hypothetical protein